MSWTDDFNEAFLAGEAAMQCEICGERYYVDDQHECDPEILQDYIRWLGRKEQNENDT
jgi:hypothetical protein